MKTSVANIWKVSICKKNLFVLQSLKDMLQTRPPAGKVPIDSLALLSWDGSDGCCDGCLDVSNGLDVVLIHLVLEVPLQIKVWRVQVWCVP